MNETDFHTNAQAAETFRRLSEDPDAQEFWTGYLRGLRRRHHGEEFGTAAEHDAWLAAAQSTDRSRKLRGLGYQAGFEGKNVQAAMAALVSWQHMSALGRRGGQAKSEAKTAAARENPKGRRGGRPPKI